MEKRLLSRSSSDRKCANPGQCRGHGRFPTIHQTKRPVSYSPPKRKVGRGVVTMLVLVILAIVWIVVLGPGLLRRRAERHSSDSIGAFHRQLHVLGRTGPTIVDPVHRLSTEIPVASGLFRAPGSRRLMLRPDLPLAGDGPVAVGARRIDPYFRPEACKRRRDVMLALVSAIVFTGLLGAIPALRPLLYVTIACAVFVGAYVGLLVTLRRHAVEREEKLRYLPQPAGMDAPPARRAAVR